MADNTTELEVLNQIVDVLGGQSGQYKTVVPVLEDIRDLLGGGGGGGGSYNPSLSVGRADALTGVDKTAQWAQRVTAGSGAATVRSVQGAAVAFNQLCDSIFPNGNVQFNESAITVQNHIYLFIADVTMKEGETSAGVDIYGRQVGGSVQLLARVLTQATRASLIFTMPVGGLVGGSSHDEGHFWGYTLNTTQSASNGMLFDLTTMFGSGNEPATVEEFERMFPEPYYPYSAPTLKPVQIAGIASTTANGGELDAIEWPTQTLRAAGSVADMLYSDHVDVRVGVRAYQSGDESDATVRTDGTTTFYPLTTPTTTPISPALPTTYRVQAGGSESIIVPTGEVSAAPVLTIAEGESAAELVMDALACIAAPDGPVATANHSVGTYLTMQGKLYKVTSAIAVGETIKSGTNVTETTVMAELIARTA